ncbi:MAG TPA: hypothetical protein ENJ28_08705 [Gammaproteobacteria bacterium]|nr:hypothetical protein [Gammaproteobacteria bacterium]
MWLTYPNFAMKTFVFVLILFHSGILLAETSLYKYAINLESNKKKIESPINLKDFKINSKYKLYQSRVSLGRNRSFYRLRIGFFKSKKEANRVARKFKSKYSKLWVDSIQKEDRKTLVAWLASGKISRVKNKNTNSKKGITRKPSNKEKKAKKLMSRANLAMKNKKYRLAVGLYTRVIRLKNTTQHQQAMEFLGLAREKNNQLIHARAEYRLYLKRYPKGEDSLRVRQRLLSLKTLLLKPRRRLKKRKLKISNWQFFGSLLQFYRLDSFNSNQANTNNETFSTNVNFLLRKRTESLNIKSQFNASDLDYINNPLRTGKGRINVFFVDIADLNNNKSIRLGRQTQSKGGVLGKMDGVWLGYRITPEWKLNFVSGFPVQTSTSNSAESNRPFIGVSADIKTSAKNWNFNIYTINQKVDSILDRNAIGGEVRYRKGKQNHFILMDYDTYFSELNTLFYVGNWRFKNNSSIVLTLSHRNSPILTTTNATVGQSTTSIENLLLTYTEDQLQQFAKDRTAKYNSAVISTSIPLTKKWTFLADGTVSSLSSLPASGGVQAIEGTGNEFFYVAQLIGYNVFNAAETTRYALLLDETKTFKRTRLRLSARFRLKNKKWRFRPQFTLEKRNNSNGGITNKVKAALKFDYKIKRKVKFEFDLSYETGKTTFPVSLTENNYSISAGYIWDF